MGNYSRFLIRVIIVVSITWSITFYLYWKLTSSKDINSSSDPNINLTPKIQLWNNDKIDSKGKGYLKKTKNLFEGNSLDIEIKYPKKYNKITSKDIKYFKTKHKSTIKEIQPKSLQVANNSIETNLDLGIIKTPEDKKIKDEGYKMYAFNALVSERIGDTRIIPDTRNELCKYQKYHDNLPDVSIIICFHNEHFQTLTRSVYSILDRTPHRLLKEIILIDDQSNIEFLHESIEKFVADLTNQLIKKASVDENKITDEINQSKIVKIKLLNLNNREGLIRARMKGADIATGKVLIFLDSHIEVNTDWLQPLLMRLSENVTDENSWSNRIVIPIIDIINGDTFQYKSSPLVKGGFNWGLHYKWDNVPRELLATKNDFIKPIKTPTMAGGLFAMYRKYFNKMGKYDAGMDIWGGENLEISFRIWMCGGTLEIIPCSRIGHVFRSRRPYGSADGKDSMLKNSLRMAHVWMDSYIDMYFKRIPHAISEDYGNVSDRVALRKSLNCKSFQWYLDNIYPEMVLDTDNENEVKKKTNLDDVFNKFQPWFSRTRDYLDSFRIKLYNSTLCIQAAKDVKTKGGTLILATCSENIKQIWYETAKKELVLGKMLCLEASSSGDGQPTLSKCHEMAGTQEWHHKVKNGEFIYNIAAGTCLGAEEKLIGSPIIMTICRNSNKILWDFVRK